jgi:truncated hemoglobin YjbI
MANDISPGAHEQAHGPLLPRVTDPQPELRGFRFSVGEPPHGAGLYVLTRRIGDFVHPVLIASAQDMAEDAANFALREPGVAQLVDGVLWMERPQARQRTEILRDLVRSYNPPLNTEYRTRRAAAQIVALVPDRAENDPSLAQPTDLVAALTDTEADLDRLVRRFYATAMEDDLIGPVFRRAVADWEQHFRIVRDFWSKSLLGTTRYNGMPFAAHLNLDLKPAFFERWLEIFRATARQELSGPGADRAIAKVEHMSACFQAGLFPSAAERRRPPLVARG